jgi:hypothetical protein
LLTKSAAKFCTYRTHAIGTLKILIICHIPLYDKTVAINASKLISYIFLHNKDNSEQYVNTSLGPFLKQITAEESNYTLTERKCTSIHCRKFNAGTMAVSDE